MSDSSSYLLDTMSDMGSILEVQSMIFDTESTVRPLYTPMELKMLLSKPQQLVQEVGKTLELVTFSTGFATYIVNPYSNTLIRNQNTGDTETNVAYEIGKGSVLAAFTAHEGRSETHITSDYNPNYPMGIGNHPTSHLHVLSLPVMAEEKLKVLGVIEVYRAEPYSEDEKLIGITIADWLGAVLEQHEKTEVARNETRLHKSMFQALTLYFDNNDIDQLSKSVWWNMKNALKVSSITLYRIVPGDPDRAYIYEETSPNEVVCSEKAKKVKKGDAFIANVMETKQVLKLRSDKLDEKDEQFRYSLNHNDINAIMCVPILGNKSIVGIMKLLRDKRFMPFTLEDEELIMNSATYYSIALSYADISHKHQNVEKLLVADTDLLMSMLDPCPHDLKALMTSSKTEELPPNFLTFSYYPFQLEEFRLVELSVVLLNLAVKDVFSGTENIMRFVLMSRKIYRNNYYHNLEHAFNTLHFLMNIKFLADSVYSELEWEALLIAAWCHDMDHPGYTNNYLKATSHSLVELYQDSVLEHHHSFVANMLIKQNQLFMKKSKKSYKLAMDWVHEGILCTDLAVYFKRSQVLTNLLMKKAFLWNNIEHRQLIKSVIMTACDLSSNFKPPNVAVELAHKLYHEFYNQGDRERILGLEPISMMDRKLITNVPMEQVNFLRLICLPCAQFLIEVLPQLRIIISHLPSLLDYWLEKAKEWGIITDEDYQRNKEHNDLLFKKEDDGRASRMSSEFT